MRLGLTTLTYQARDRRPHGWLLEQDDWVPLGAADEKKLAA
jgi:hypothetical protein